MKLFPRLLAGLTVFLISVPVFGIAILVASSYIFTCPPDVSTCDLPAMVAFGLACLVAPFLGAVAAVFTFFRLKKRPLLETSPDSSDNT